jgi:hypothetical protein
VDSDLYVDGDSDLVPDANAVAVVVLNAIDWRAGLQLAASKKRDSDSDYVWD